MRRILLSLLCLCMLWASVVSVPLSAYADENSTDIDLTEQIETASDITKDTAITSRGFGRGWAMTDGAFRYYAEGTAGAAVSISANEAIGGIYILFDSEYGSWSITDGSDKSIEKDEEYIHQYVDTAAVFGSECLSLTLSFAETGAKISEIYVLGLGECPSWVQRWEPTPERTDILLVSAHSDDEHLFFAGILPYYTAKGRIVTVAYLTEHYDKHERRHERLDGLWTAGVRNYPLVLGITDNYSEDLKWAESNLKSDGHTVDEVDSLLVGLLRRTKPLVVFTHDFEGEYGHGQHMLLAASLARALKVSADPEQYPESAAKYGAFEVPKAYFHLWGEGKIYFRWDEPLEELGGRSPFEVSRDAFLCHSSQIPSKFHRWIFGDTGVEVKVASDIVDYSPLEFGLYHSTVGEDTGIGDVFEHLTPYSDEGKTDSADTSSETSSETLPDTLPETASDEITESGATIPETSLPSSDTDAVSDALADGEDNGIYVLVIAAVAIAGVVCASLIMINRMKKR